MIKTKLMSYSQDNGLLLPNMGQAENNLFGVIPTMKSGNHVGFFKDL